MSFCSQRGPDSQGPLVFFYFPFLFLLPLFSPFLKGFLCTSPYSSSLLLCSSAPGLFTAGAAAVVAASLVPLCSASASARATDRDIILSRPPS